MSISTTQKLINSCLDFVLGKNNFHNENKIKLHFIDGYDKLTITKQKLDKYFKEDKNNKIAIIFLDGFIELNEGKINQMINLILSKFSEKSSDFLIKKMIYFIGKNEWFQHLKSTKYQIIIFLLYPLILMKIIPFFQKFLW
ncbi:hypothetical protein [Mycoplasmopsis canis]|uniref:hypothetical protein n=1 Tax=Mycoplasmopsis canis TaxID=29555 RepID=UPI001CB78233|nr:hypothetical protein [Mycoplasmopsis canis]